MCSKWRWCGKGFIQVNAASLVILFLFFKHLPSGLPEAGTAYISWATSKIFSVHIFLLYILKKFMLKGAMKKLLLLAIIAGVKKSLWGTKLSVI